MDVYIETNDHGSVFAFAPALPGCFARANDEESALAALAQAATQWQANAARWEIAAPPVDGQWTVVERMDVGSEPRDGTVSRALFAIDHAPLDEETLAYHLAVAKHSRADFLATLTSVSGNTRQWRPFRDADSIEEIAKHVAIAELWFANRLSNEQGGRQPLAGETLLDQLAETRSHLLARLNGLSADERAAVFTPPVKPGTAAEAWTARKLLRRFLVHEQDHHAQIRDQIEAWRLSC